jgi:dimethylaniline monooxygenase (N-oxide forming)
LSSFFNDTKANAPFAGPTGLAALKNLREEGFSVTVFEKRGCVGGIWAYTDDVDTTTALPCEAKI